MDVVMVTLAHPIDAADGASLGLGAVAYGVGAQVAIPVDQVRRIYSSGLIVQTTSLDEMLAGARPPSIEAGLPVFIGPTQPVVEPGTQYVWHQTGTGSDGTGTTIWIEDGA